MDAKEAVRQYIQTHEKEAISLLQKLIQQPSIRGNEGEAQAIIIEKCRELGLVMDIWELDELTELKNHPAFYNDRKSFKSAPNLVATLKGKGNGKSLILNGHIDVVPEGNLASWTYQPYGGHVEDGKIYGRGSTDMKGGNVALLLALEAIIQTKLALKGDVYFQSVIEEESGGAGTLAAVLRGYKADGAIIPEPTDMKFFPHQQGSLWFRIRILGKSAHGGTRYEGVSSLELAYDVMQALKNLEQERNEGLRNEPLYEKLPIPIPINIGICRSGNWPSSVPDETILEGRFGVSPYESVEQAMTSMEEVISHLNEEHYWFQEKPLELEWFGARWIPGKLESSHPLVQTLQHNFVLVEQTQPVIEASPWGTDGGILSTVADIPTIVFGPGTTSKAHDSNEYIEIDKMLHAAEIIALTILDWCEIDGEMLVVRSEESHDSTKDDRGNGR